jgi:esterase/lipase
MFYLFNDIFRRKPLTISSFALCIEYIIALSFVLVNRLTASFADFVKNLSRIFFQKAIIFSHGFRILKAKEGGMEKFIIGIALGGLTGALLTANNYKMRLLVRKGQEEVQTKLDKMLDEKIESLEAGVENIKTEAKEQAKKSVKKAKKKIKNVSESNADK